MKIYSLQCGDRELLGFQDNNDILDLTRAIELYEIASGEGASAPVLDMEALIWDGRFRREYFGDVMEFVEKRGLGADLAVDSEVKTNAPLYPGKIIALGHNYLAHIKELGNDIPERPVIFGKWPSITIGHGDAIVKPAMVGRMDYEAELALVIGEQAKHVPASDAMRYVAGYTCMNDVTARDLQATDRELRDPWMQSKNFDTFAPLGPCVLVGGEDPAPSFEVRSSVNGETRQHGSTRDFLFDIPHIIEYITSIMTLEAGDVISTGTPKGVGPIEPGDTVEVACTGIGSLINPVVAPNKE